MLNTRLDEDKQPGAETKRYRALFISDIHLGTKACQAEAFLDFLRHHDAPRVYLVGDIVDFWRIRRGIYWPQPHNDVLQKLLRKVRKGTAGASKAWRRSQLSHADTVPHAALPHIP